MVDRKTLMSMYQEATRDKYSFMLVNLLANDAEHMFYWGLDKRLIPALEDESPWERPCGCPHRAVEA